MDDVKDSVGDGQQAIGKMGKESEGGEEVPERHGFRDALPLRKFQDPEG